MREFLPKPCRTEVPQAQAFICGTANCTRVCGGVLFCPAACGVIIQAHIRNLPGSGFFGLQIESCGSCIPLPQLLSWNGDALMSVYLGGVSVCGLLGSSVAVTDGCPSGCTRRVIACGEVRPCGMLHRCHTDRRPLFAAPIHC